jgi:hypothetical protein
VTLLFIKEGFKANERSRGRWQIANFRFKISRRNYRPVSETALRMESLWEKV